MDERDFPALISGLLRPQAYPHPAFDLAHVETHISHVLLAGDYAYKLKKPIELGFLDFSTLDRRRHCCHEEIRLNRRLASKLYLGVVAVTGDPLSPRVGGDGPALEYAVQMRRFPDDARLDRLDLGPEIVDALADQVATFHEQIPNVDPASRFGTPDAVLAPMLENLRHVRGCIDERADRDLLDRLEGWTRARWRELTPLIEQRRRDGHVRECHGDMHRANVALVEGRVLIFDAIEFSPDLRWIDTASELAFLVMDLEEAGQEGFARRLLNRYLARSGDYGALAVLDFYKVYRAMVRAKVLAIRRSQGDVEAPERERDRVDCARYLRLAESYTRARRSRLVITCGLSGSGKSRLALRLREAAPMIHLRSDVERKRLFGLPPEARTTAEIADRIYSEEATERTYRRLRALAETVLDCGYDALVDATFLSRARRRLFLELALEKGAGFAILSLGAPLEELAHRVARRLAAGIDVSEASLAVLASQRGARESLDDAERRHVIPVDTSETPSLPDVLEHIEAITGR